MKLSIFFLVCAVVLSAFAVAAPVDAGVCTPNAQLKCVSNISYWHDSCGALQSVAKNCNTTNQVCQNGQCVNKTTPTPPTTGQTPDYKAICAAYCGGQTPATPSTPATPTTPGTPAQPQTSQLQISLLGTKEAEPAMWGKFLNTAHNDKLVFLVMVKNNSTQAVNSASLIVELTSNISYTGNLKIDNTLSAGNITSGIELGGLAPNAAKLISFTGTVQGQANATTSQVISKATSGEVTTSDSLVVSIAAGQVAGASTASVGDSPFMQFLKKWYLWIIIVAVLIALFVIIFRRLSTNV